MESKILIENYDYILYVDASGDVGLKFEKRTGFGSSTCYTVAAVLVEQSNRLNNHRILQTIKNSVGMKLTDEFKYATIKRHPKSKRIHEEFNNLYCEVLTFSLNKKTLQKELALETNNTVISINSHIFPILQILDTLNRNPKMKDKKLLIAIDRMKERRRNDWRR